MRMSSFVVELSYHPIVLPMTYSARGCVWWLFVVMGQSPLNSYLESPSQVRVFVAVEK